MKFFRILFLSASILVFLPLLHGCGAEPGPVSATDPGRGGTVVIGVRQDIDTFNLYATTSAFTQQIADLLFLRLAREQPDSRDHPPTFSPEFAESWDFSEDGLSITFHLRKDVKWSDGTPTTAGDVLYSWEISRDPEVAWINADVKEHIEDVEILDDFTIRFHFRLKYPYQLMDANDGNIYPRHVLEKIPVGQWRSTDWSRILFYNGPFLLEEWNSQDSINLVRNPDFFEPGAPGLERVVFRIIPDPTSLLTQLRSGEIDIMEDLPPRDLAAIRREQHLQVIEYPDRYFQYICWNMDNPLFQESEVRRALSMGIDMEKILDSLLYGTAILASSPIISFFYEHDDSLKPIPYRPEETRRILARHGWADTDGDGWLDREGKTFSFELETNAGNQVREDAAIMIQAQLAKLGIQVQPRVIEFTVFQQKHMDGDFDSFIAAWKVSTKVDYLKPLFHSDSPVNYPSYRNPHLDDLIGKAPTLPDPADALPLWQEAQRILYRDQPYTLMYERQAVHGVNRRLRGVRMDHLGPYAHLKEWWIPPDKRRF